MPYIDFAEIKSRVQIEDVLPFLGLKLTKVGHQFRGPCPVCRRGGDRALVITPDKKAFYCFAAEKGGDVLALVAKIRGVDVKTAAQLLLSSFSVADDSTSSTVQVSKNHATAPQNQSREPTRPTRESCPVLDYLKHDHPAVEAIGFNAETAKALGVGYAPKGMMRGSVAVPVRLEDGSLAGYIGITEAKLPPKFFLEPTNVVPFKKGVA